jgi:primosomal protein N'
MYILEVIPIQKGIPRDTLSYYSTREIPLGALVEIPLHSKTISGIVISRNKARDLKANIRSGSFSLKPIGSVLEEKGFPSKILMTLQELAVDTLIPLGTLITTLFPEHIFFYFQQWKALTRENIETRIVTLPTVDRWDYYKTLIRESCSKKHSIQFITATTAENDALSKFLINAFDKEAVVTLSGSVSPAKREQAYKKIRESQDPLIICTTPQFFVVPSDTLGSCVIESSCSPYYVQDFTMHVDYRLIMIKLMHLFGYQAYLADSVSSPEQEDLIKNRQAYTERTTTKSASPASIQIIEREALNSPYYVSPIFAATTISAIQKYSDAKKPIFIFSARKGIASVTTCRDCGYTVHCPNCNNVMQLVKKNPLAETDRVFHCHRCNTEIPTMNRCPNCLGWNLTPLGITTESTAEELNKFFPDTDVFQSESTTTKTDAAVKKIINAWTERKGILIGTQKVLPFIPDTALVIIASFEHCISIPRFQTEMETLWLFQKLYEKTTEHFLIQTKDTDNLLLNSFKKQSLSSFIAEDAHLRKLYSYPPFATLVTVTLAHIKRKDHQHAKEFLRKGLQAFEHTIQSQFFEHSQEYSVIGKAHIPADVWHRYGSIERQSLAGFLASIRDHADISIEPGLE